MITEIRKRDGRIEPFDASKIANAITKAMVQRCLQNSLKRSPSLQCG